MQSVSHKFKINSQNKRHWLFVLCIFSFPFTALTQLVTITNEKPIYPFSANMEQWVDSAGETSAEQVLSKGKFIHTKGGIPIFPGHIKSVWFRFSVHNLSSSPGVFLNIDYTNLSRVSLYRVVGSQLQLLGEGGNEVIPLNVKSGSPNIIFDLLTKPDSVKHYLLHIYSKHPIIVPARILTDDALNESIHLQGIITSLYLGVLIVMFLYNFFLFFATKDNSYLYYIIYILFLAIAQTTIIGYEYRYFWPNSPALNYYAVVFSSSISAIAGLLFSMQFLRTAKYAKKANRWLQLLVGIYLFGMLSSLLGKLTISYQILNYNGLAAIVSVLAVSFYIAKKNFRPAYFYLTAWLFLLVAFMVLILRNLAILPYTNFTTYFIYVGSSIEIALLSIALADKINVLRKEKELSQAEALESMQQNEKLIRDQNSMLEKKVTERTEELQSSNSHLSKALENLKDAQIQLVEAEKMASLGQLTAGIAHEINNPINFVKSNIKPLQLDINDLISVIDEYDSLHTLEKNEFAVKLNDIEKLKKKIDIDYVKTEIESLVKGIQEGAERTAEIVSGLRNFSRLDENDFKTVNIHEGIDSTVALLKSMLPPNIKVVKNFTANGQIECLPGKLNQVFMNIVSNGIQAITAKEHTTDHESITITTEDVGHQILIRIKDSGIGMTEEIRQKVFDPFFTTKEVGEGTGLGLSIVYKIIEKHEGKIDVISSIGNGTEFLITLFHKLPESVKE